MIIDTHHHWWPKKHYDTLEKYVVRRGESLTRDADGSAHLYRNGVHITGPTPLFFEMERQIEDMNKAGVDMAVLQLPSWSEWNTVRLAPEINNACAEIVTKYPKYFVGLAHVPLEGKAAMQELERAIKELKLCGVGITTHWHDIPLDSERFYGFWEKVSELDIPVVVSPYSYPVETQALWGFDIIYSYARLENVQRAMARLVYGPLLDRFPTVKILMPHLGGGFFGYWGRISSFIDSYGKALDARMTEKEIQKAKNMQRRFSQLYFESAPPSWRPLEFKAAFDTYGEDKITLGSDYPVGPTRLKPAVDIIQNARINQRAKKKILGGNALKLFRIKRK